MTTLAWMTRPRPQLIPPSQRTAADKKTAQDADAKSHATLRKLQKESGGCADCTARISGWAALPHGAFVCINCAQIHRRIGRHISQVKAINTGTYLWYADEVELMAWGGNARVQSEFCADPKAPPRPDEGSPVEVKERYIRDKCVLGNGPCSQLFPPRRKNKTACSSYARLSSRLLFVLPCCDSSVLFIVAIKSEQYVSNKSDWKFFFSLATQCPAGTRSANGTYH